MLCVADIVNKTVQVKVPLVWLPFRVAYFRHKISLDFHCKLLELEI